MATFENTITVKFDDEQMLLLKRLERALNRFEQIITDLQNEELEAYADRIFNT